MLWIRGDHRARGKGDHRAKKRESQDRGWGGRSSSRLARFHDSGRPCGFRCHFAWCPDGPHTHPGQHLDRSQLDRARLRGGLGHPRLQRLRGDQPGRRVGRPGQRNRPRQSHQRHRDRPHQRDPLLLHREGAERRGDLGRLQRGLGDPCHLSWRPDGTHTNPGQHLDRSQLDRARLRRGLGHPRLQRLRGDQPGRRVGRPGQRNRPRHHHVLHRDRPHHRDRLLLHREGGERLRALGRLQRGLGDPRRHRA